LEESTLSRFEGTHPLGNPSSGVVADLPFAFSESRTDIPKQKILTFRQTLNFIQYDWASSVFQTVVRIGDWFQA